MYFYIRYKLASQKTLQELLHFPTHHPDTIQTQTGQTVINETVIPLPENRKVNDLYRVSPHPRDQDVAFRGSCKRPRDSQLLMGHNGSNNKPRLTTRSGHLPRPPGGLPVYPWSHYRCHEKLRRFLENPADSWISST